MKNPLKKKWCYIKYPHGDCKVCDAKPSLLERLFAFPAKLLQGIIDWYNKDVVMPYVNFVIIFYSLIGFCYFIIYLYIKWKS